MWPDIHLQDFEYIPRPLICKEYSLGTEVNCRDVYFTLFPPPGGGGIRMAKNRGVAREWDSEAVGRGVFKTFSCGKKMYDLGRRLRSFKAQMWHKCGSYKAKWWGVFMLWIIIVTHICFYFYSHATNEHEKCFRIIKILHENKWYYISISYSRATFAC